MIISNFNDLLQASRQQSQAQRLLLVFASAELPTDCTPAQREQFEVGAGGALVPCVCVDKAPEEITDFAGLSQESKQFEVNWQVVFVSSLSGMNNTPPSSQQSESALQRMVESIKVGALGNMIAFDLQGDAIDLMQ